MKVKILSVHPAPYRDVVFERLYQRSNLKIEVTHYFALDEGHREWHYIPPNYPVRYSKPLKLFFSSKPVHFDVLYQVATDSYDVIVVPGYSRLTSLFSILIARCRGKSIVLVLDTISERTKVGYFKSFFIRVVKKIILRACHAYWVPGQASLQYIASQSLRLAPIARGAYCFDASGFIKQFAKLRASQDILRIKMGIESDTVVILAVGKLTTFRRYEALLNSWAELGSTEGKVLILVGGGPQYSVLANIVKTKGLLNVKLVGPCSFEQVKHYYAISNAYVHPGTEPYSTALELAAIAGLSILANDTIGYVHDLLFLGARPLMFRSEEPSDLTSKLQILISDEYRALDCGSHLAAVAVQRTPDWAALEFESLVRIVSHLKSKN